MLDLKGRCCQSYKKEEERDSTGDCNLSFDYNSLNGSFIGCADADVPFILELIVRWLRKRGHRPLINSRVRESRDVKVCSCLADIEMRPYALAISIHHTSTFNRSDIARNAFIFFNFLSNTSSSLALPFFLVQFSLFLSCFLYSCCYYLSFTISSSYRNKR